ncbi:MAG: alkane 1-monooxygenase, partial [Sphingobacteriales bacterium]
MRLQVFKYASPLLLYIGALLSFAATGVVIWLPLLYAWVIIPLLELIIKADEQNMSAAEEELAKKDPVYDWMLYLIVPLQYLSLGWYLYNITFTTETWVDITGKTLVMGLLCGTLGINVGHELGHRIKKGEQFLAKSLLLTSLYMHFFIEHNKGHHKRVATPEDPSSARLGEPVYTFYLRSIFFSYISAWSIAFKDTAKKEQSILHNEMLHFHLIQLAFLSLIYYWCGGVTTLLFIGAAVQGILLLETVNYIEHYGLQRKALSNGRYERAMPEHSWNSNHVIGRVMLFELS